MKTRQPTTSRRGLTLIELLVSMAAGTVVLAGISSTLILATQSFEGSSPAIEQNRTTDVRDTMADDIRFATAFTSRENDEMIVVVPDRDGDGKPETIEYKWTGATDKKITRKVNTGTVITVAEDITDADFSYGSRTFTGNVADPGASDSSEWGERWSNNEKRFGFINTYSSKSNNPGYIFVVQATLPEDGTLNSLSAYFDPKNANGDNGSVALAVYSSKNNKPDKLLVGSASATLSQEGWVTVSVTETSLSQGKYFLALYYTGSNWEHRHYTSIFSSPISYKVSHSGGSWPSTYPNTNDREWSFISLYGSYTPDN